MQFLCIKIPTYAPLIVAPVAGAPPPLFGKALKILTAMVVRGVQGWMCELPSTFGFENLRVGIYFGFGIPFCVHFSLYFGIILHHTHAYSKTLCIQTGK